MGTSPLLGRSACLLSMWSSGSGEASSLESVRGCFTGRESSVSALEVRLRFLDAPLREGGVLSAGLSFSWLVVERVARAMVKGDLRHD